MTANNIKSRSNSIKNYNSHQVMACLNQPSRHCDRNQREHLQVVKSLISLTLLALLYSCQYNHIVHCHDLPLPYEPLGPLIVDKFQDLATEPLKASDGDDYESASASARDEPGLGLALEPSTVAPTGPPLPSYHNDPARLKLFEEFKNSKLFLPPYEEHIKYLPDEQVQFVRKSAEENLVLFKKIINEAVDTRKSFMPSARLMLKYGGRLIATFLRNRANELQLKNRYEPLKSFFLMLADLVDRIIARSVEVKRERGYTKNNVDAEGFRRGSTAVFEYCNKIVAASPLAAYHKWTKLVLFNDDPKNPKYQGNFFEEASDLLAVSLSSTAVD